MKITPHTYVFPIYCPRDCNASASGKMETLLRLLRRLKAKGHRVVLFSQFTRFMDIVDDFLNMAGYSFVRLDGSTNRVQRMVVSLVIWTHLSGFHCFCKLCCYCTLSLCIPSLSLYTLSLSRICSVSEYIPGLGLFLLARS